MNSARRLCLMSAVASGLGAALPLVSSSAASAATTAQPGDMIDWPPLRLLDGSTLAPAQWQGAPAVVVFWATWCAHCKRHNAHIDKLHRALAGRPPRIISVAVDSDAAGVRRYMATHGYQFPVTLDAEPLRSRLTTRRMVPMTIIIDARGRLKQAIPGEMFEADVLELAGLV